MLWTKQKKILVNSENKLIVCSECPCTPSAPVWIMRVDRSPIFKTESPPCDNRKFYDGCLAAYVLGTTETLDPSCDFSVTDNPTVTDHFYITPPTGDYISSMYAEYVSSYDYYEDVTCTLPSGTTVDVTSGCTLLTYKLKEGVTFTISINLKDCIIEGLITLSDKVGRDWELEMDVGESQVIKIDAITDDEIDAAEGGYHKILYQADGYEVSDEYTLGLRSSGLLTGHIVYLKNLAKYHLLLASWGDTPSGTLSATGCEYGGEWTDLTSGETPPWSVEPGTTVTVTNSTNAKVTIGWYRDKPLNLITWYMLPNETRTLTNPGDAQDTYIVTSLEFSDAVAVLYPSETLTLEPGTATDGVYLESVLIEDVDVTCVCRLLTLKQELNISDSGETTSNTPVLPIELSRKVSGKYTTIEGEVKDFYGWPYVPLTPPITT